VLYEQRFNRLVRLRRSRSALPALQDYYTTRGDFQLCPVNRA
jgi:hypothetical protein